MASEEVSIELKNKPPNGDKDTITYQGSTTTGTGNVKITVERTTHPLGSDFLKYEHTLQTKGEFILKEIQDNGGKIDVIGLKDVPRNDGGSNEWIVLGGHNHSKPPLIGGDIERTLDDLVCSNYDAVTLDLGKSVSFSGDKPYCCRCVYHGDNDDQRKIFVTLRKVFCKQHTQNSIQYCKHTIKNPQNRVARIRYYIGDTDTNTHSNRRRIKYIGLDLPMDGVKAVYASYCDGNPVLIYVDGGDKAEGWYKKGGDSSTGDENWTKVDLPGITPTNFNSLTCEHWKVLVKVLKSTGGCKSLQECPKGTVKQLQEQSQQLARADEEKESGDEVEEEEKKKKKGDEELGAKGSQESAGSDGPRGPTVPGEEDDTGSVGEGTTSPGSPPSGLRYSQYAPQDYGIDKQLHYIKTFPPQIHSDTYN
ncbi:hypothetical protein BEWA_035610 [Theileria equi strain WA]|uniref:Uncharacterized protein n=1 Tax=Theileria equi strain WA TaxID=1537102 RepID=L1LE48_THEEQ|nr:hypothetical protein BEWA_035610 [Theileria equi strain WA]EKX73525.1 hypothetical protein BEWA_035610 [Theileria equi strain WA]|eukprot:XP_004832977.1 hypothetical protein BEWA_035610 [Theileria equi strain WA]